MAFELVNSDNVPVLQSVCSILQLPSFVSYATFLEILFNHAEVQEGNHDFYMNQLLKYISHKANSNSDTSKFPHYFNTKISENKYKVGLISSEEFGRFLT